MWRSKDYFNKQGYHGWMFFAGDDLTESTHLDSHLLTAWWPRYGCDQDKFVYSKCMSIWHTLCECLDSMLRQFGLRSLMMCVVHNRLDTALGMVLFIYFLLIYMYTYESEDLHLMKWIIEGYFLDNWRWVRSQSSLLLRPLWRAWMSSSSLTIIVCSRPRVHA